VVAHLPEKQCIETGALRALGATSGLGHKRRVILIEWHRIKREQNVLLDPCGEVAQWQQYASIFAAIPYRAEGGIEGFLLLRLWQFGRQETPPQWKSWTGTSLMPYGTAYEGKFYKGRLKTKASKAPFPVSEQVRPVIEAWRRICKDSSPEALMFPTFGRGERIGQAVPDTPSHSQAGDS
jgi:hypothetical protein